jgi:hypothetical protein
LRSQRLDGQKDPALAGHGIHFGAFWGDRFRGKEESTGILLNGRPRGRCSDLTGGGLIRSAGGWRPVKEAYRDGIRLSSDERILGSSGFVEQTLKRAGEAYDRKTRLRSAGVDLSQVIEAVCRELEVDGKELTGTSKRLKVAHARAMVSHIATRGLSISGSEVARRLKGDRSACAVQPRRSRMARIWLQPQGAFWDRLDISATLKQRPPQFERSSGSKTNRYSARFRIVSGSRLRGWVSASSQRGTWSL